MSDERSDQVQVPSQVEETAQCGPGCNCGATGLRRNGKLAICLIVIAAAILVLARGFARKAETGTAQAKTAFATTVPASIPKTPAAEKANGTQTNQATSAVWGEPLAGLTDLNQVAAQTQAVFIYLPKKGQGPIASVKQQIEEAAGKAQSGGTKMGCYTLDANSDDYAKVTSQIPSPCVLAMVKGGGGSAVSGEITEEKLLQAIVSASRPSSCGPSGCAPSTPGCN